MIDFLLRPWRRHFGPDKAYYRIIDDMFGFVPHNIELYKLALIHKSASLVLEDGRSINNERLEYLGDAVIEAVTSDYIFIEYPDRDEGFMTQLRSKIVSRQSLNALAERLGLDQQVIATHGAGISQKHIYGDAFEAMMGAIYLDQGYDFVNRLLINRIYARLLDLETLTRSETDFKSRLIEWCQKITTRCFSGRDPRRMRRLRIIRSSIVRCLWTAWRSATASAIRRRRPSSMRPSPSRST